jgi:hypothetical protein
MSRETFIPIFPIPTGYFHEDERPCYHVPPPRPSWLRRLWQHLSKHGPTASMTVVAGWPTRWSKSSSHETPLANTAPTPADRGRSTAEGSSLPISLGLDCTL